jgi:hypothetical protein
LYCHQVLHWFEHNLPVVASDGDGGRDYAAEAKLLACRLLEEQCGTVALLLTSMSKVRVICDSLALLLRWCAQQNYGLQMCC